MLKRSLKNLIRSPMRTIFTIVLLALSVGLALVMLSINGVFQNQMDSVKSNVGTAIEVRPAGSFALLGGGKPMPDSDIAKIESLLHVTSVEKAAQAMYTGSSLESSLTLGPMARRQISRILGSNSSQFPIITMGFEPTNQSPTLMGGAHLQVQTGRYFNTDESNANVAIAGETLATKNNLQLDSMVDIESTQVKIIGIFSAGQMFGDSMLIMPYATEQRLFELSGATSVTVEADTVQNVQSVAASIRQTLGTSNVDVVTSIDIYNRISNALENVSQTSKTGMIVSFFIAGAIILFSMFLTVRQRTKEIGILKAIGASNMYVGLQFGLESLELSVLAAILGALMTFPVARQVGRLMTLASGGQGGMLGARMMNAGTAGGASNAVSPVIFLYALAAAVGLAILSSALLSWYVGRVKPVEVLRNE